MLQRQSIHQLPQQLINRIAAGEVIERPANVVKELVENAIDAGSSSILIEVQDGGRALIRVTDDGGGIPADELPLAFAPHATSKIQNDDDLFRIATMGFRGEALASIGSVSHARILSRVAGSDAGYELFNRGGEISDTQAAAANIGTAVEVRNLFFNTPARRKFIKGTATEYGHIAEMVLRLSLPHPSAAFELRHNDRVTLRLPATSAEERLLAAWPKEFHEQRLPLNTGDAELRLHGLIGLPELARPTAKYQFIYLNGRHIRDRFIQHALREAYRGLTEPGRHPAAVLLLEVPPGDVDVNVHPTKIEVRFRDGSRIHGLVHAGVRERLLGSDLTPSAQPKPATPDIETARLDLRQKLADFFRKPPDHQLPLDMGSQDPPTPSRSPTGTSTELPAGSPQSSLGTFRSTGGGYPAVRGVGVPVGGLPAWKHSHPTPLPASQVAFDSAAAPGQLPGSPTTSLPDSQLPRSPTPASGSPVHILSQRGEDTAPPPHSPMTLPTALQLHNTYLVAESDDGMVIIDQHALHERIVFEDLLARVMRGPLESQRMLIPSQFRASSGQLAMLEQISPLLARLGIEAAAFGPDSVAVHAFPSFLLKLDPGEFVCELLERGEQELLDLHEEELLHGVLDMMACKAAVKAGDVLSPPEIQALLARRDLVERSSNCPHGRPTTLRLSLRDLEKQFKRTGF